MKNHMDSRTNNLPSSTAANRVFRASKPMYLAMTAATLFAAAPATLFAQAGTAEAAQATEAAASESQVRNPHELDERIRDEKFDLGRKNLALEGYDPVSYFAEGGSNPVKGSKKITYTYKGVTYRFKTQQNLQTFKADPDRYEPAFGGWCAYAMAKETYTEPNPERFTIHEGRLYLFYDGLFGDTYEDWFEEGPDTLDPLAIEYWDAELEEEANS